jgi:hypothetical protein
MLVWSVFATVLRGWYAAATLDEAIARLGPDARPLAGYGESYFRRSEAAYRRLIERATFESSSSEQGTSDGPASQQP